MKEEWFLGRGVDEEEAGALDAGRASLVLAALLGVFLALGVAMAVT